MVLWIKERCMTVGVSCVMFISLRSTENAISNEITAFMSRFDFVRLFLYTKATDYNYMKDKLSP